MKKVVRLSVLQMLWVEVSHFGYELCGGKDQQPIFTVVSIRMCTTCAYLCVFIIRVGQNIYTHNVNPVFGAGKSPHVRSYTVCMYSSGRPTHVCMCRMSTTSVQVPHLFPKDELSSMLDDVHVQMQMH